MDADANRNRGRRLKSNDYFKGLLKGLLVGIAGQLDKNSNSDREFLEKLHVFLKSEVAQ